jgi:phytol kinase
MLAGVSRAPGAARALGSRSAGARPPRAAAAAAASCRAHAPAARLWPRPASAALRRRRPAAPARRAAPPPPAASAGALAAEALRAPAVRDAAAFAASVIGSRLLIRLFQELEKRGVVDQMLSRKLVHTLAGPLFVACWPLFSAAPAARAAAAAVPALNAARLVLAGTGVTKDERAVRAMTRTGDPAELLRGPLYYTLVLAAITAAFWRASPVGLVVAAMMCGGDGLADVVGRRAGRGNPLPWNPAKSWAGSAAMFIGGAGMAAALLALYCRLGYLHLAAHPTAAAVLAVAALATGVESLPVNARVDDNLSVPGVAAAAGWALLSLAAEAA